MHVHIHVRDAADQPVPGVVVDLMTAPVPADAWVSGSTDGSGYVMLTVPAGLRDTQLRVHAPAGFVDVDRYELVSADITIVTHLAAAVPLIVFPTTDELRRWRGVFCIPGAMPDGSRVWTPAYGTYDDTGRAAMRAAVRRRRYQQVTLLYAGLPYCGDYPLLQPDPARLQRDIEECWRDGLWPMVCVATETLEGDDDARFAGNARRIRELAASPAQPLIKLIMLGYETNGWMSPAQHYALVDLVHELFPDALLYIHFTAGHGAIDDPAAPSYRLVTGKVRGLLVQTKAWVGEPFDGSGLTDAEAEGLQSTIDRLNPALGAGVYYPGVDIDCVIYEYATSVTYRGIWSEAQGVAAGDWYLRRVRGLFGFGDGGTP